MDNRYFVLYLLPDNLINENKFLELQWENIKTLVPCLLKSLYEGSLDVRLHEFDRILTGLRNIYNTSNVNILGKVASLWYYFTRIFHQSFGPRVGNFAEELICHVIDNSGLFRVIKRNGTLKEILKHYDFQCDRKQRVDLVLDRVKGGKISFIELRMSEHTGGKTAQESLLDKFVVILPLLEEGLRERMLDNNIREVELVIAILFNKRHEIINNQNMDVGRFNSLVNYIMEERNIWGQVRRLLGQGYRIEENEEGGEDKNIFEEQLKRKRDVCIRKNEFRVRFRILLGDEFFREYAGKDLNTIIEEVAYVTADDIWLFYSMAINEMKVAKETGKTNVRRLYEDLKREKEEIFKEFMDLRNRNIDINKYISELNRIIDSYAKEILGFYEKKGIELRLLETNDIISMYEYLKQLCLAVLSVYLTIDIKGDNTFSTCMWE